MKYLLGQFLVIILLSSSLADTCGPLYWEVDPNYKIPVDEFSLYSRKEIAPNDISATTTENLTKVTFKLSEIKGKATYDSSRQIITNLPDRAISVDNSIVNVAFSFLANKTGSLTTKGYNGTGTANINNMVFNLTKKLVIANGTADYKLVSVKFNPLEGASNGNFKPEISVKADNTTFFKLIVEALPGEVKDMISSTISNDIEQILEDESIENTFGSINSTYTFAGFSVVFNSSFSSVVVNGTKGSQIGYDMQVVGVSSACSNFTPSPADRAAYYTLQFMQNLLKYSAKTNSNWQNMRLDNTVIMSDYFQFYLIDMESIMPEVLNRFHNMLAPLYANCTSQGANWDVKIDSTYNLVKASVTWDCSLFLSDGNVRLLDVTVPLGYELALSGRNSSIRAVINTVQLGTAVWKAADTTMPITNENLANVYLGSLVDKFRGRTALGTGLPTPYDSVQLQYDPAYLKINPLKMAQQ